MQSDLFGLSGRTDDAATLDELEVDYTPPAVALLLLLALQEIEGERPAWRPRWRPRRYLDPSAGSCVWPRAVRAVFGPDLHIVGVEPRVSEAENMRAACDAVVIGEAEDLAGRLSAPFDLIATNPPFERAFRGRRPGHPAGSPWPFLMLELGLVAPGGTVALYGLSTWGQSAEAAPWLQRWAPSLQLRLGGRPAHRADGATDQREYSLWVWRAPDIFSMRPSWLTVQLPTMSPALRRWSPSAVPGTYPLDAALVEDVRGYL